MTTRPAEPARSGTGPRPRREQGGHRASAALHGALLADRAPARARSAPIGRRRSRTISSPVFGNPALGISRGTHLVGGAASPSDASDRAGDDRLPHALLRARRAQPLDDASDRRGPRARRRRALGRRAVHAPPRQGRRALLRLGGVHPPAERAARRARHALAALRLRPDARPHGGGRVRSGPRLRGRRPRARRVGLPADPRRRRVLRRATRRLRAGRWGRTTLRIPPSCSSTSASPSGSS